MDRFIKKEVIGDWKKAMPYWAWSLQKLQQLKKWALENSQPIAIKNYSLPVLGLDPDDAPINLTIKIAMFPTYDLLRFEIPSPGFDRIFLYNEFGCSFWGMENQTNCSLIQLCYMQIYKLGINARDKQHVFYTISGSPKVDVNYLPQFMFYNASEYSMLTFSDPSFKQHIIFAHYKTPKTYVRGRATFNEKNGIYIDWSFHTPYKYLSKTYVGQYSPQQIAYGQIGTGYASLSQIWNRDWGFYNDVLEHEERTDAQYTSMTRTLMISGGGEKPITAFSGGLSATFGRNIKDYAVKYLNGITDPHIILVSDYDIKAAPDIFVAMYLTENYNYDTSETTGSHENWAAGNGMWGFGEASSEHNWDELTTKETKHNLVIRVGTGSTLIMKELASYMETTRHHESHTTSTSGEAYFNPSSGGLIFNSETVVHNPPEIFDVKTRTMEGTIAHSLSSQINDKFLLYTYTISEYITEIMNEKFTIRDLKKVVGVVNLSDKNFAIGYNQEFEYLPLEKATIGLATKKIDSKSASKNPINIYYRFRIGYFNPLNLVIADDECIEYVTKNEMISSIQLKWAQQTGATGYLIFVNGRIWKTVMDGKLNGITYSDFDGKQPMTTDAVIFPTMLNVAAIGTDFKYSKKGA